MVCYTLYAIILMLTGMFYSFNLSVPDGVRVCKSPIPIHAPATGDIGQSKPYPYEVKQEVPLSRGKGIEVPSFPQGKGELGNCFNGIKPYTHISNQTHDSLQGESNRLCLLFVSFYIILSNNIHH